MCISRTLLYAPSIALIAAWTLASTPAAAQSDEADVPLDRFHLSMDAEGILDVEWAEVAPHLTWDLALWFDFADDPLVLYREGGDDRIGSLVSSRLTANVMGSIGLWDRVQVGVALPIVLLQSGESLAELMSPEPSGFGIGDLRLMPKVKVLERAGVHLAVMPTLIVPTGTADAFGSEAGLAFAPEVIASRAFGAVRLSGGLGYLARTNADFADLEVNDELFAHVGAGYRLSENGGPPLEIDLTFSGATAASAPLDQSNQNHVELRAGASYRIQGPLVAFAGAGLGLRQGFGTPDWRGLLGVRWSPARGTDSDGDGIYDDDDSCPLTAEDRDGFEDSDGCPDDDNDSDKIPDSEDGAPNDPEDYDDFEDQDGVPDPDNDQDGIDDFRDECPTEAEVMNGVDDEDGCPDELADRDGDGIADDKDGCPDSPEDVDSFEDQDGCPDEDNDEDGTLDTADRCPIEPGPTANRGCPDTDRDGDGVVDRLDNCPNEAGPADNAGCVKQQRVRKGRDGRIEILDPVYFASNSDRILERSFPLLRNVAQVLKADPDIDRLRIEGHTDNRGDASYNQELSQRRAQAVVAFLIDQGVDRGRLTAVGVGETQPIASNKTKRGRATNRRVEFVILDANGNPRK
ncbi:MAG: hypothetical protein Tsb0020_43620 [Haliangiales bacterium]